jgi:hypothetical protein
MKWINFDEQTPPPGLVVLFYSPYQVHQGYQETEERFFAGSYDTRRGVGHISVVRPDNRQVSLYEVTHWCEIPEEPSVREYSDVFAKRRDKYFAALREVKKV